MGAMDFPGTRVDLRLGGVDSPSPLMDVSVISLAGTLSPLIDESVVGLSAIL